jgi:ketosteroid isomerase-like protein
MPEESTTPDLVELVGDVFGAVNRRDFDAMLSHFAPDAVWEAAPLGVSFEGVAAIRGFFEDWIGSYDEFEMEPEEALDLGNGVVFSVSLQRGRPLGSTGVVQVRSGFVAVLVGGMIVQVMVYPDIDEARADAERLAEERAQSDV